MQLTGLLPRIREEDAREKLALAAFVSFQMGSAGKMTYGEYLYHLGLSDKPPQRAEEASPQYREDDTLVLKRMGIEVKKVKNQ